MKHIVGLFSLVMALFVASATAQTTATGPQECGALSSLQLPGVGLTEISADWMPVGPAPDSSTLPVYCRFRATLDRRQGSDGQPYGIGFTLALPATWNGRFLFQGGSGFNGVLLVPYGPVAADGTSALARGFAVVATDSGHKSTTGNVIDSTFQRDQQATIDFAYRAIERVTAVSKAIVERYYAGPISRSYFAGCSTGGREAMVAAQRYPLEFDGVIVGSPAMRTNDAAIGANWVNVQLNAVAPRGTNGQPVTKDALSSTQKQAVIDGIRKACDANDGVRDGRIFNPSACTFDPKTLACGGTTAGASCLSPAQTSALERAFAGPRTDDGRQLYAPFPFDTGIMDTQGIGGLLNGAFNPSPVQTPDLAAAERWADSDSPSTLVNTSGWTNLTTFVSHGGKLLMFHGLSDPLYSALDTVDYYARLTAANGGADAAKGWSRLFLVPGMGHCTGGSQTTDSFDLLTALVNWVERGVPVDSVVARPARQPGPTRPLCAYPKYAYYSGRGDSNDAANFECRTP